MPTNQTKITLLLFCRNARKRGFRFQKLEEIYKYTLFIPVKL